MKLKEVICPALLFVLGIVTAAVAIESRSAEQGESAKRGNLSEQIDFSDSSQRPTPKSDQVDSGAQRSQAANPWREAERRSPPADATKTTDNSPVAETAKPPSKAPEFKAAEPNSELRPLDVVQIQVSAIRAAASEKKVMETCFAFASPSNKAATGPVENFTRLVLEPPYSELAYADRVQYGNEYIVGDSAEVLVTTYREPGLCGAYRFTMTKQTQPPNAGCWMTDMVVPLSTVDNSGREVPGTLTPQTNVD